VGGSLKNDANTNTEIILLDYMNNLSVTKNPFRGAWCGDATFYHNPIYDSILIGTGLINYDPVYRQIRGYISVDGKSNLYFDTNADAEKIAFIGTVSNDGTFISSDPNGKHSTINGTSEKFKIIDYFGQAMITGYMSQYLEIKMIPACIPFRL
jgi:hypothetical protein